MGGITVSSQPPGPTVDGKLFFSGTAYLGLSQNLDFKKLLSEGIERYGLSFGISRNGNYQLDIYNYTESILAQYLKQPSVLTFSSGMMAGQALVKYFEAQGFIFEYAPGTHQALWLNAKLSLPNVDFENWAHQMLRQPFNLPTVLCLNSFDALRCADWPIQKLNALIENPNIFLLIDHSHGLGVLNLPFMIAKNVCYVASTHKALSLAGGLIVGDGEIINKVRSQAFFTSGSPMLPAVAYVLSHLPTLISEATSELIANIDLFKRLIGQNIEQFSFYQNFPVFYTKDSSLFNFLLSKNIFIYQFAYPDPQGEPNTRVVISAWHTIDDIQKLAAAINAYF